MGYSPFLIWEWYESNLHHNMKHKRIVFCLFCVVQQKCFLFWRRQGWHQKETPHPLLLHPFCYSSTAPFSCQRHLFQLAIDKLDNYAEHVFKVSIWELKKIENTINFLNVLFNLFICKLNIVIGLMSHSKLFYYGYL